MQPAPRLSPLPVSGPPENLQLGVSYFGNRHVAHAERDLAEIAKVCTYVVHTFSEIDLHFHKRVIEQIFRKTRQLRLSLWVDPWGVGGVFGGETFSRFLLEHPECWQVLSSGPSVPAACLGNPAFIGYVKEWILNVADLGAQVVLWDEPHPYVTLDNELRGIFTCRCGLCQVDFRKRYGREMPDRLTPEIQEFRHVTMRNFLCEIMAFARRKRLRNALTIYAFQGVAEYDRLWEGAAMLPDLDIFGCDPYWRWRGVRDPAAHVRFFARKVIYSCQVNKKEPHLWIQAMRLPRNAHKEIPIAIQAAYAEGIRNVAAWSFDGGALLDPTLSQDPPRVWEAVAASYRALRTEHAALTGLLHPKKRR